MHTVYTDETGFTGEDLLSTEQPVFVQATCNFDAVETAAIIKDFFGAIKAVELKHNALARRPAHQERVVDFVRFISQSPGRTATWIAHKEYAACTFVVDLWVEPLAHRIGLNLYHDGANHGLANLLFMCLQAYWSKRIRAKILLAFQRMFRARTQERFAECRSLILELRKRSLLDEMRSDILSYLWNSFPLLGLEHLRELPERSLDLALPGLVQLMHSWRAKHAGPWQIVHDRSSNMAKQKWLWDMIASPELGEAAFDAPHLPNIFPLNVTLTRFADSITEPQIQLCDLFAGATAASRRLPDGHPYKTSFIEAGIQTPMIGSLWPSEAVTPEALGRKGWDGNLAIEWLSTEFARMEIRSRD